MGQLKRGFYADGCSEYLDRLSKIASAELITVKDGAGPNRQGIESDALLAKAEGLVVALDERGKSFTSQQLARQVTEWENRAVSRVSLLIGGPDGHTDGLRQRADLVWKLSDLTMPHELARLVLLEQLYRAETIRSGHPYHRQ